MLSATAYRHRMTTAEHVAPRPLGELQRGWRERRRLSQMDLALETEISTRHLSFVETGRSAPSREMVLRLAEQLDLPLRERNQLLLAGGYAPVYSQAPLDAPELSEVRAAVRQVLTGHEPYPAAAFDRHWNIVEANSGIALMTAGVAPELLEAQPNAMRLALHPGGLAPRIANLGEWRAHLLSRLRRQVALTADPVLADLLDEVRAYPFDDDEPEIEIPGAGEVFVPLRLRHGDGELQFFSTVTTFGTPLDVTVSELAIESFFPADEATAAALRV